MLPELQRASILSSINQRPEEQLVITVDRRWQPCALTAKAQLSSDTRQIAC
jgi:hypothetical protein